MTKFFLAAFIIIFASRDIAAQAISYGTLKQEFESFEYEKVILLSDELLKSQQLTDSIKVDVHLMRAISFFSVREEVKCKNSFVEILKINKNWTPDPSTISPVIIPIFNEAKTEFAKSEAPEEIKEEMPGDLPVNIFNAELMKESAIRNLLLPGWGHLHSGNKSKGTILTAVSASMLAASIYFIIDTNKKENEYLAAVDKVSISENYDRYNTAYKIRNTLLISYAAVWIFGQLDLLFLSGDSFYMETRPSKTNISFGNHSDLEINFKIPF